MKTMTHKFIFLFLWGSLSSPLYAAVEKDSQMPPFHYKITPIPASISQQMRSYTWRPGCPIDLKDLAYLQLSYWGMDHKVHQGELIVNQLLAKETAMIFQELYQQKFPIEQVTLMDNFHGDDNKAMEANNSSAFNCRAITGKPGVYSLHSYGRAIDINTRLNPYVKGNVVEPSNGKMYVDRSLKIPGMIHKDDGVYHAFISRGWSWGGDWTSLKDYQHFEKKGNDS